MNEESWRKLETVSRLLLSALIIVFVFVAVGTYKETQEVKEVIRSGNCSYLLEENIVEKYGEEGLPLDSENGKNFSFTKEKNDVQDHG